MKKLIIIILLIVLLGPSELFILETKGEEPPKVIINELMWMGSGLSSYDEWIELKNTGNSPVDLSGWYLTKKSSGEEKLMLKIPEENNISDFFIIANYSEESTKCSLAKEPDLVDSAVSLSNSQLMIKLYDNNDTLIDVADDGSGKPLAGEYTSSEIWKSMERNGKIENGTLETSWHTAEESEGFKNNSIEFGSPGWGNSNSVPIAEAGDDQTVFVNEKVFFDASDSFDPDGDDLKYSWNFGDGEAGKGVTPTHVYKKIGDYFITLTLNDGLNKATDSLTVDVYKEEEKTFVPLPGEEEKKEPEKPEDEEENVIKYQYSDKILFNEIFPNPEGSDKDFEFIELINIGEKDIDLIGWQIICGDKDYAFKEETVIKNRDFLVLRYEQTKMYLKNSGQTFQLVDPKEKIINGVEYKKAKEGQSYSRKPGTNLWAWSLEITEGKENEVIEEIEDTEILEEARDTEEMEDEDVIPEKSIEEAKKLDKGDEVIVRGFVSVEPEIFGTQYFYIFDGKAGIKIYSSKKLFPELTIGDYVKVSGVTSESTGEKKINIKVKQDIEKLDAPGNFPEAIRISLDKINDDLAGALIFVSGEIYDLSSTKLLLGSEEGEIEAYFKKGTGIKKDGLEEGMEADILGVLIPYKEGYRILPRNKEDIRAENIGSETEKTENIGGKVLGIEETNEIDILADSKKDTVTKYLITVLCGLVLALSGLGVKWYRKKKAKA